MFGEMRLIQIEQDDETIVIRPTNHDKLEAWSGKGIPAEHRAILPRNANANECGSAALSALERCT